MKTLIAVILFLSVFGTAHARHPEGTPTPRIDIQSAPPSVVSAAICHYYSDYHTFTKKWEEIKLIPDEAVRNSSLKNLLLMTWAECIINMHVEINSYKQSF
jgi:hypothetical protein